MKTPIENLKSEVQGPKRIRSPKSEGASERPGPYSTFGFRTLFGFRLSGFGLLLLLSTLNSQLSTAHAQGSLTPDAAPAPTMKTLEQVEPRTALEAGADLGSMFITEPGSYYLTGDREVGGTVFFVRTNNVTIDLNGYTLRRSGSPGAIGIHVDGSDTTPYHGITIRNGTITGFNYGIQLSAVSGCIIENVTVTDVGQTAFFVEANGGQASGNLFRQCVVLRPGFSGFYLSGNNGNCHGNQVINCSVIGTTGTGISTSGHGFELFGGSGGTGSCTGNIFENCTASGNFRSGFILVASSGVCEGNRISGCTASLNGESGFDLGSGSTGRLYGNIVENSQSVSNAASGIFLSGLGGALGNKLSGNVCIANDEYGIRTTGSDAGLTINNLCVTNASGNFNLDSTDINGPIVTISGTLGTTGADAHPHANYSR